MSLGRLQRTVLRWAEFQVDRRELALTHGSSFIDDATFVSLASSSAGGWGAAGGDVTGLVQRLAAPDLDASLRDAAVQGIATLLLGSACAQAEGTAELLALSAAGSLTPALVSPLVAALLPALERAIVWTEGKATLLPSGAPPPPGGTPGCPPAPMPGSLLTLLLHLVLGPGAEEAGAAQLGGWVASLAAYLSDDKRLHAWLQGSTPPAGSTARLCCTLDAQAALLRALALATSRLAAIVPAVEALSAPSLRSWLSLARLLGRVARMLRAKAAGQGAAAAQGLKVSVELLLLLEHKWAEEGSASLAIGLAFLLPDAAPEGCDGARWESARARLEGLAPRALAPLALCRALIRQDGGLPPDIAETAVGLAVLGVSSPSHSAYVALLTRYACALGTATPLNTTPVLSAKAAARLFWATHSDISNAAMASTGPASESDAKWVRVELRRACLTALDRGLEAQGSAAGDNSGEEEEAAWLRAAASGVLSAVLPGSGAALVPSVRGTYTLIALLLASGTGAGHVLATEDDDKGALRLLLDAVEGALACAERGVEVREVPGAKESGAVESPLLVMDAEEAASKAFNARVLHGLETARGGAGSRPRGAQGGLLGLAGALPSQPLLLAVGLPQPLGAAVARPILSIRGLACAALLRGADVGGSAPRRATPAALLDFVLDAGGLVPALQAACQRAGFPALQLLSAVQPDIGRFIGRSSEEGRAACWVVVSSALECAAGEGEGEGGEGLEEGGQPGRHLHVTAPLAFAVATSLLAQSEVVPALRRAEGGGSHEQRVQLLPAEGGEVACRLLTLLSAAAAAVEKAVSGGGAAEGQSEGHPLWPSALLLARALDKEALPLPELISPVCDILWAAIAGAGGGRRGAGRKRKREGSEEEDEESEGEDAEERKAVDAALPVATTLFAALPAAARALSSLERALYDTAEGRPQGKWGALCDALGAGLPGLAVQLGRLAEVAVAAAGPDVQASTGRGRGRGRGRAGRPRGRGRGRARSARGDSPRSPSAATPRSRNKLVDTWLREPGPEGGNEGDGGGYADLDDFIVE